MIPLRPRRLLLALLLAGVGLGLGSPSETCGGPFGDEPRCHARDPATDHDGQEPEKRSCPD
jgi:hypothetical protein